MSTHGCDKMAHAPRNELEKIMSTYHWSEKPVIEENKKRNIEKVKEETKVDVTQRLHKLPKKEIFKRFGYTKFLKRKVTWLVAQ